MSDLSGKFSGLEEQLTTQHAEEQAALDAVNARLDEFSVTLDTLINNNAANTRYLLAALAQLDPCTDCTGRLPLPPPYIGGALPVDTDKCKRIQAFLDAVGSFAAAYDTLVSYNVVATLSLINSTISSVLSGLIGGDDVPLPSIPEATNIVGNYFSFASANIFESLSAADGLASIYEDAKQAMYIASGAEGMVGAFTSVIDGSSLNFTVANLLKSTAYNALANYYLSPESEPDLSAYDGAGCTAGIHDITACTDFEAIPITLGGNLFYYIPSTPLVGPQEMYFGGDFFGWTFELIEGTVGRAIDVYRTTDGVDFFFTLGLGLPSEPTVMAQHSFGIAIATHDINELAFPFTVRICPPA